jgi:hypothetical protein
VPQKKDLKRLVRTRMAGTGENYTQALAHVQGQADLEPLPAAWHVTGDRAPDYEAGILPAVTYDWRSARRHTGPATNDAGTSHRFRRRSPRP